MPSSGSRGLGIRLRRPRWTLRLRLTLLYGGLFLAAGAALLAITYELVVHSSSQPASRSLIFSRSPGIDVPPPNAVPPRFAKQGVLVQARGRNAPPSTFQAYAGRVNATFRRLTAAQNEQLHQLAGKAQVALHVQRSAQLGALLTTSGIALGIMAILSVGLGWLMAGRALRPIRTMSARARGISERNLHARLALEGPDDELKELGDTFDELLARLESAFESQRRFVANASHELRTPITLERTLVEVALADPGATLDSLRDTCQRVLAAGEQQERMIEALLTLARSQRGLKSRHELDLSEVAGDALAGLLPTGVRVEAELAEAPAYGDPALLERLISNLLDNAVRYNREHDGRMWLWTGARDARSLVRVSNTGPVLTPEQARAMIEPFRRLGGDRTDTGGAGLGLSIVAAIARAHDAELSITPRSGGGLDVQISVSAPVWAASATPRESGRPLVSRVGGVPLAS
jgi:signal transduction histidine kinase